MHLTDHCAPANRTRELRTVSNCGAARPYRSATLLLAAVGLHLLDGPHPAIAWDAKNFHKPTEAVLRQTLTRVQYTVTQQAGTEPPFRNEYTDNHAPGIYVDVVSGEPLFSSLDKFDSGTGWPSFSKPLVADNIRTRVDRGFFTERTEVRSVHADSHLGHVFQDGPPPTGLRYCMNSAALRFIPADRLAAEGYAEFVPLFRSLRTPEAERAK